MKKYVCFLLIFFLILLSSCSGAEPSAEEILLSISEKLPSLSYGKLYLSGRMTGDEHYMSPSLFWAVFDSSSSQYIEEYAIYLSSFTVPCEIAVFKCFSPSDSKRIERMCLRRLDHLKHYFVGTEYEDVVNSPVLSVKGRTVIFIIAPNAQNIFQQ